MIGKKNSKPLSKKKFNESILNELKNSIESFNLEKRDFISIIDGMLMDVKKKFNFQVAMNWSFIVEELLLPLDIYQ